MKLHRFARRVCRVILWGAALAFLLQLTIGVFGLPAGVVRWMIGLDEPAVGSPAYVIVLGGGGIPSESGLIRTYHAARFAGENPRADVIVALPSDEDPATSSVGRMKDELVLRGVPARTIRMEHKGRNTHEQAVNIADMLGPEARTQPIVIVTSPSHIRRSLQCFRKQGFLHVRGFAASSVGAEADLGALTGMRYSFWGNQRLWIDYLREWCAMVVYKLRGWT